jgi:hypothetical protein
MDIIQIYPVTDGGILSIFALVHLRGSASAEPKAQQLAEPITPNSLTADQNQRAANQNGTRSPR